MLSLLDEVRKRPDMWVLDFSLRQLEELIRGYYIALSVHGIDEGVPEMRRHVMDWLSCRKRWRDARGWSWAIDQRKPKPEAAFKTFYRLVDEYRQLQPTILASVQLGPKHDPTGKRIVIGYDRRIERPDRIDILRYQPEPLHFFRFHYGQMVHVQDLLYTSSGSCITTFSDAKRWVREEFQVKSTEWQKA